MSLDIDIRFTGSFRSYVTFDNQACSLRNYHWLTAFFLNIFKCGDSIVIVHTKRNETLYLSRRDFESWRKNYNVSLAKNENISQFINRACVEIRRISKLKSELQKIEQHGIEPAQAALQIINTEKLSFDWENRLHSIQNKLSQIAAISEPKANLLKKIIEELLSNNLSDETKKILHEKQREFNIFLPKALDNHFFGERYVHVNAIEHWIISELERHFEAQLSTFNQNLAKQEWANASQILIALKKFSFTDTQIEILANCSKAMILIEDFSKHKSFDLLDQFSKQIFEITSKLKKDKNNSAIAIEQACKELGKIFKLEMELLKIEKLVGDDANSALEIINKERLAHDWDKRLLQIKSKLLICPFLSKEKLVLINNAIEDLKNNVLSSETAKWLKANVIKFNITAPKNLPLEFFIERFLCVNALEQTICFELDTYVNEQLIKFEKHLAILQWVEANFILDELAKLDLNEQHADKIKACRNEISIIWEFNEKCLKNCPNVNEIFAKLSNLSSKLEKEVHAKIKKWKLRLKFDVKDAPLFQTFVRDFQEPLKETFNEIDISTSLEDLKVNLSSDIFKIENNLSNKDLQNILNLRKPQYLILIKKLLFFKLMNKIENILNTEIWDSLVFQIINDQQVSVITTYKLRIENADSSPILVTVVENITKKVLKS